MLVATEVVIFTWLTKKGFKWYNTQDNFSKKIKSGQTKFYLCDGKDQQGSECDFKIKIVGLWHDVNEDGKQLWRAYYAGEHVQH